MLYRIKILISAIAVFLMIAASSFGCAFSISPNTIGKNQDNELEPLSFDPDIVIPDDYSTIQEGINHANPGNNILVRSGIYKENIVVDKEGLYLQGENKFTTIINGGKITDTIVISAPSVTIQGFTITNGWNENEYLWDVSGVRILSSNVTIKGNRITSNRLGINVVTPTRNLTISDNSFIDDGIFFGNYVYSYKMTEEDFLHTVTNNTVNGKPLYYYKNKRDFIVPNDAGQIILANCTNVTIKDMYFTHVDFPIILGFCSHCVIENLKVDDTWGEIIIMHSENNTIQNNTLSNMMHGICLDFGSKNNLVQYNKVFHNYIGISVLTSSSNNRVYSNIVHDNGVGIEVSTYFSKLQSHGNTISENEIYNNNLGIQISKASFDNVIQDNDISKNKIGLLLKDSSNDNTIRYNNFKKNFPISALFTDCSTNNWDHNYWNRPRILPKPIVGLKMVGKIPIPWINIDRHPASGPYEI